MPGNASKRKHRRFYHVRKRGKPGAPPGTIVADPQAHETVIEMFGFGPQGYEEYPTAKPDLAISLLAKWPVTWVNVDGLRDTETVRRIAEIFKLHPLVLEDVVNVHQRAKVEEYGDELFVVARMATLERDGELETEQLAIVLGANFVVTFQERPGDTLGPVRERIRKGTPIRRSGADYLMYALVDAVLDNYFPVLEVYGERLEGLEEEVLVYPDQEALRKIHKARRDLLLLRRAIWPQRDALATLSRESFGLVQESTRVFLRDCHDHVIQVMDLVESYREMSAALIEVHLSQVSNRLNEVMKVLTIIAAVFSPLTFIAGVYGMNFRVMPELQWAFGYPLALVLMGATGVITVAYFWHRGWIGDRWMKRRRAEARAAAAS